jgi:hypothetical protein
VAGVALDSGSGDAALLGAVRRAFRSWVELLAAQLRSAGLARSRAACIAEVVLAALEGALILCRADGSAEPLEVVSRELVRLVSLEPPAAMRRSAG